MIVSPYIFDVIIPVVSGQGSQQKPKLRVQQYFAGSGGAANAGAGGIGQATVQVMVIGQRASVMLPDSLLTG